MTFEWDEAKNQSNIHKHGISFETAKQVFDGPLLTMVDNRFDYGETRKISVGMIKAIVVLVVIHTDRSNNTTRIISARKANKAERFRYEKALRERIES